ncbi:MAG: RHS repeat protein, partial [Acidobacteria bacterium]|nr:RHS repeat protein [Acidobacteriota bacterium]
MNLNRFSRSLRFITLPLQLLSRFFYRGFHRKLVCLALILSLLILPVQGTSVQEMRGFAVNTLQLSVAPMHSFSALYDWLFGARKAPRKKLSLADRIAMVSSLRLSPAKFVGYVGDTLALNALPVDASGKTVQGVRLSWESSNSNKLQIGDTGVARLLQPGQVRVICRAGSAETSVPVLIHPGSRPPQTHAEWDDDQAQLSEDGTVSGENTGGEDERHEVAVEEHQVDVAMDSFEPNAPFANPMDTSRVDALATSSILSRSSARSVEALFEKPVPLASAQSNGCMALGDSTDFGYDELYSDPRNLVGSPRYRATEGVNMEAVLPESSNFDLAVPLYSLNGRGPGLNLTLFYNSRVWSRHGSAVTYNAVNGFPFAGFSLGFGRILTYGSGSTTKYVLIDADGTRHYLGTGSDTTTTTYETTDGTHITFVGSKTGGGSLYSNNGTKVTITVYNNLLLPTRIRDANGNYISIGYKTYNSFSFPWRQAIDSITDTLGRYITFGYDSFANLTSITTPALNNGTQTLVQFDYQCNTVSNSFSGLTVENRPTSAVPMLRHIYFPATQTGYKFSYSAYGMAYKATLRKDMTIDVNGVIADGIQKAGIEYNYPTAAASLTDAPSFSQRVESALNAPTSTYTYSSSTGAGTKTFTITRPDSSKLLLTRSTTGATDGLLIETQIQDSSSTAMAKSVVTYTTDGGSNTQVQSITNYDDTNTPTKVDFDYDNYGNVTNKRDYGFQINGNWQVRRRSRMVYKTDTAYLNAYLRNRVIESDLYDAQQNTNDNDDVMLAKTTLTYDDYNAMSGMEVYTGQAEAPSHDLSFDASVTVRGNVTGVTQYKDVAASQTIARLKKYDKYGNVVKEQLSCCNEIVLAMNQTNGYAVPVEEIRGSGSTTLTSSTATDFNTGLVVSQIDPQGKTTTYAYDAAERVDLVTAPTGATQNSNYNDSAMTTTQSVTYTENGSTNTVSATNMYDGWGRVVSAVDANGGQVNITYDAMGRKWKQTNPFPAGQTPGAQTVNTFDALGRTTLVTLPDNNTVQASYSGATVTMTDQVNRKMKRESDGLGRLIKVTEPDSSTGNLTQETSYTYDLMDNLTEVNQGSQYRKFKYDSLGRMLFEKIPEQTATINDGTGTYWTTKYVYTDFNAPSTKTDARGVVTTYTYDTMNRMTGISYNVSGASGVAATPSVSYSYD